MQNLGIGDLSLPHPIDSHRPVGYQMPEVNYNDETITFETGTPDIAATTGMYSTYVIHTQTHLIQRITQQALKSIVVILQP